jgi:hypothetical protein
MRPADDDDRLQCPTTLGQCGAQFAERRQQGGFDHRYRGDVHDRRKDIVRRLAAVYVVIRVDRRAGQLRCQIGNDLVGVHVGLRSRAGLEHDQRELAVMRAGDDRVGGAYDRPDLVLRQLTEPSVDQRRRLLDHTQRADHRPAPDEPAAADREIVERALRLRTPQPVGRHLDRTQAVVFAACLGLGHGRKSPCRVPVSVYVS